MKHVIAASRNPNKIRELQAILQKFDIEVLSRDAAGIPDFEIEEDGESFLENAYKKAITISEYTGLATIADDSGLCVDALGGQPGIYSARYAGDMATDEENNAKLLALMADLPEDKRTAKFHCAIALIIPGKEAIDAEGEISGMILTEPAGSNGFGYDPLFRPDGYNLSFAEIGSKTKNAISHRARALEALNEKLSKRYG